MNDLADTFDKKCSVIRDAGQVFRDHLAGEVLEVDDEKIMLDEHMEAFKVLCEQKETKLRGLWKEYVEVQKQIMELALVVLDEDNVLVAASIADEDGKLGEGQREAKDPELDESSVHERRGEFEQHQIDAVNALDGFKQTLDNVTSKALEKNKDIFDASLPARWTLNTLTEPLDLRNRAEANEGHDRQFSRQRARVVKMTHRLQACWSLKAATRESRHKSRSVKQPHKQLDLHRLRGRRDTGFSSLLFLNDMTPLMLEPPKHNTLQIALHFCCKGTATLFSQW